MRLLFIRLIPLHHHLSEERARNTCAEEQHELHMLPCLLSLFRLISFENHLNFEKIRTSRRRRRRNGQLRDLPASLQEEISLTFCPPYAETGRALQVALALSEKALSLELIPMTGMW